ncbi:MAG: PAS domain-containing protein [Deltaproteobacteria bacterium]|nr:PAS domain-containing protein [Deltaproteobacteria bacterium]
MKSKSDKELELLSRALETFHQASGQLEQSYSQLEEKVEVLTRELEKKNRDLVRNLEEKEKMKCYLHNILESLRTGVIVLDLSCRITVCNRAVEELICESPQTIRKKGLASVLGTAGRGSKDQEDLRSLMKMLDQTSIVRVNGRQERTIHLSTSVLNDEEENVIGGIILLKDVTEIRRLEEEAARRNRLTSMGEMAANIAHEIRNPLGGIELFASLLKEELKDDPDRAVLVSNISAGVQSLNHILSNLLYYSRPLRPVFLPLSVQGILDESLVFAGHLLGQKGIRWSCEHAGEDRELISDGELLKQIFMNLILNAVQAMPGGGDLRVTSEIGEKEVEFRIADNGPGIPEESLQRIFHPFYTTRPKGTGLGLAIVHQLVETLGGKISVESRVGEGTTFFIVFPLAGGSSGSGMGILTSRIREVPGVISAS